ncbi:hypothetical protein NliqN6_5191 [Naganishia liquefaciens]|uniref:CFEM domain-containing protein n=1 Tax=Naganishia liquefaciens TaxID=104408 RepID=A0A8H3TZ06_9TREE|nr:hypothetical protein NliqN6_5191 [Naganishia liquefaciens]
MKLPSLLWLSMSMVSASLNSRQAAGIPDSCSSICGIAAIVESSTQPRCDLSDAACLCADNGWAMSFQQCLNEICPPDSVQQLYQSWYDQCQFLGVPLANSPSITGSITLQSIPGPVSTATAFSSVKSVFQSAMGEEFAKASASYAAELSAAATQMAETTGAVSPMVTPFTSSSPSGAPSAIPMSAGNMLFPSAGLWAALFMVFAFMGLLGK